LPLERFLPCQFRVDFGLPTQVEGFVNSVFCEMLRQAEAVQSDRIDATLVGAVYEFQLRLPSSATPIWDDHTGLTSRSISPVAQSKNQPKLTPGRGASIGADISKRGI
jgi:hypothetical protein